METVDEKLHEDLVKIEREEKLNRKIEEVRRKNQEREKRFKEAEEDKKRAESQGCSVTLKRVDCTSAPVLFPRERSKDERRGESQHGKTKKYLPATSEEWRQYILEKDLEKEILKEKEGLLEGKEFKRQEFTKKKLNTKASKGFQHLTENHTNGITMMKNNIKINRNNNKMDANNNNNGNENIIITKNVINNKKKIKFSEKALTYTPKKPTTNHSDDKLPPPDPANSFLADSYRDALNVDRRDPSRSSRQSNVVPLNNFRGKFTSKTTNHFNNNTYDNRSNTKRPGDARVLITTGVQALPSPSHQHHHPQHKQRHHQQPHKNIFANDHFVKHHKKPKAIGSGRLVDKIDNMKTDGINGNMEGSKKETKPLKSILKKTVPCFEEGSFVAVITTLGDVCQQDMVKHYPESPSGVTNHTDNDDEEWEDVDDDDDEADSNFTICKNNTVTITTTTAADAPSSDIIDATNTETFKSPTTDINNNLSNHTVERLGDEASDEETHESFQKFIEENTLKVDPVCIYMNAL